MANIHKLCEMDLYKISLQWFDIEIMYEVLPMQSKWHIVYIQVQKVIVS